MQLTLRKPANAGLLPRVVVMETVEDDAQGRGEGAGRQQSGLKLSCDAARHRQPGVRGQERSSGAGQGEAPVERAQVPAVLAATTERVRGKRDVRGGVEVTAEECLLISLCHGFQRLSCEECSGRDNRTRNVSLCDKFSRRHLESLLLLWAPCSPPRASGPGSARLDLGQSRDVKIPGLVKI